MSNTVKNEIVVTPVKKSVKKSTKKPVAPVTTIAPVESKIIVHW